MVRMGRSGTVKELGRRLTSAGSTPRALARVPGTA
ncbi:MAG: hypothetical protein JWN04_2390, partial [Myxococcaceae bacterium]|nr:hypothetical protein [Myxococcaceae bacterium]